MSEDHFSYGRYPDPAAWLTGELRDELKKITADRDRLAGEVERLKAQVRFASETDPAMRAEAAEAERDRLAGEVERLKEERDAARDDEELMSKAKQLCEAERDRLAGEVARLKEERDAAITDRFDAAAERIKAVTAERDRLSGEVATVRSARDMHHANYELMKAHNKEPFGKLSAAELERDRLAGEVERLKDQNTAWADKYGDTQNAMYAALDERDRLKAALEPFAKLSTDRERQDPPEGTMRVRVVTAPEIEAARKALGDAS